MGTINAISDTTNYKIRTTTLTKKTIYIHESKKYMFMFEANDRLPKPYHFKLPFKILKEYKIIQN